MFKKLKLEYIDEFLKSCSLKIYIDEDRLRSLEPELISFISSLIFSPKFLKGLKSLLKSIDGVDILEPCIFGIEILTLSLKSIFGDILNFPRACLTLDRIIEYNELSFSNLTSILLG